MVIIAVTSFNLWEDLRWKLRCGKVERFAEGHIGSAGNEFNDYF